MFWPAWSPKCCFRNSRLISPDRLESYFQPPKITAIFGSSTSRPFSRPSADIPGLSVDSPRSWTRLRRGQIVVMEEQEHPSPLTFLLTSFVVMSDYEGCSCSSMFVTEQNSSFLRVLFCYAEGGHPVPPPYHPPTSSSTRWTSSPRSSRSLLFIAIQLCSLRSVRL